MRPELRAAVAGSPPKPTAAAGRSVREPSEFDDPEVQVKVLGPDTILLTLERPVEYDHATEIVTGRGKKRKTDKIVEKRWTTEPFAIILPTEFRLGDLRVRRIFDDLMAFQELIRVEIGKFVTPTSSVADTLRYFDVIFKKGAIREEIRGLLAQIAIVADSDPERRPGLLELADAMGVKEYSFVALYFMRRGGEEIDRQKKVRATSLPPTGTQGVAGSATSTRRSPSPRGGRRKRSTG